MNNLWAPWRIQFIEDLREKSDGCIFCEMREPGNDRERLILARFQHAYIVMNRYPYNSGHLLIVPSKHTGKPADLTHEEQAALMELSSQSVEILMDKLGADGANCGMNIGRSAGAGIVDHVHVHVVPRWNGDTNFMPIISDTRSMPEYLESTYGRLVESFKKLEKSA